MLHGNISRETAKGIAFLREKIEEAGVPGSKLDETINIATWNIRHFGEKPREDSAIHYLAEVMNQFDIIGITELHNNLGDLKRVMDLLGPYWDVVFCDSIDDAGGNEERIAYLFDTRAVVHTGLAAELNPARVKTSSGEYLLDKISWWRNPYMASFSAGSFDFVLITAHIRWGKGVSSRKKPIKLLADWVHDRRESGFAVDKDIIVMGDFNITSTRSSLYKLITSRGLNMPKSLSKLKLGTNLGQTKHYDQILHYPTHQERFTERAGVVDFYGNGSEDILFPGKNYSKSKFTHQMSDHLPLWAQINIDLEDDELNQILN